MVVSDYWIEGKECPVIIARCVSDVRIWRLDNGQIVKKLAEPRVKAVTTRRISDKECPIIMLGGMNDVMQTRCLETGRLFVSVPSLQQLALDTVRRIDYWMGLPRAMIKSCVWRLKN